jgi:hypothetical protein
MTKSAIVFGPQYEKLIKNLPTNSFKEPKEFVGKQRANSEETQSTGTSRIWIPAFAGMTEAGLRLDPLISTGGFQDERGSYR